MCEVQIEHRDDLPKPSDSIIANKEGAISRWGMTKTGFVSRTRQRNRRLRLVVSELTMEDYADEYGDEPAAEVAPHPCESLSIRVGLCWKSPTRMVEHTHGSADYAWHHIRVNLLASVWASAGKAPHGW